MEVRETASHARPQRHTPPETTPAPRFLAVVILLTAALALGRALWVGISAARPLPSSPPPTAVPPASLDAFTPLAPPPPEATETPAGPLPIGIVAGHRGNDSGAVCGDLQEVDINTAVAERVVNALTALGYPVDLLDEFDGRLQGYRARVLVSIHADSCIYPEASGFKVARASGSLVPATEDHLVECLVRGYGSRTGLAFHEGSITPDMTDYHAFYEIDPQTPAAIIEIGFMGADRDLLLMRQDLVAQGIVDGILCFLEP
jgi:N-acetylmuramoyl-L-alanine amidase